MHKLIKQFNRQDATLVVSDYPETSKMGEKNHGIAWYTKEFIEPIVKRYKMRFVVLAQKGSDNEPKLYKNKHILVLRVFDHGHLVLFPIILRWLFVFNYIKNVQVHSEFCANGSLRNEILLIPFLLLIKLTRKNITYFAHNVITDINPFISHLGISRNKTLINMLNFGLKYYYQLLGMVVDKFVVMDQVLYDRLSLSIDPEKIIYSPFWIKQKKNSLSKNKARVKLGISQKDFVLLSFGFITYYKGSDWIIEAVKKLKEKSAFKNIRLILAGGRSFSLKHKKDYQRYYENLKNKVSKETSIEITGFVSEPKIPLYFKAADVVVLPYRGLMGGSGSLVHALSFHKPFILSSKMKDVIKGNGIVSSPLVFTHHFSSFESALKKLKKQKIKTDMEKLSRQLAKNYDIEKLLPKTYEKLFVKNSIDVSIYRNLWLRKTPA